jgi:hypothetical protein
VAAWRNFRVSPRLSGADTHHSTEWRQGDADSGCENRVQSIAEVPDMQDPLLQFVLEQ